MTDLSGSVTQTIELQKETENKEFRLKAGLFFTAIGGLSAIAGFGATLSAAKRHDSKYFNKGLIGSKEMHETGASLALRALGWGTLYAFAGCGILFYSIWKISGAQNFQEFRYKIGSVLPRLPKNDPPRGRTEFTGMNDLLEYLQTRK